MNPKYNALFEPFELNEGIQLKNRLVLAPMTHSSSNPDETVSDAELEYYASRTTGVGLAITAVAHVTPGGKGFANQFRAVGEEFTPGLTRLAETLKKNGAKAVLQIFHAGRLAPPELVNNDVAAPSAVPSERGDGGQGPTPRELTGQEIEDIIKDFGKATANAIAAGFDGVEIHGANGYLIQQFFSPHSNRREDKWGGDVHQRLAFPLAVVDEVQRVVKEQAKGPFIVGYRFSPEEPETPGITMADTLVLIDALADKNLSYLHTSLMEYTSVPRRGVEDTRSRLEIIQERVGAKVPVIGVGSVKTPDDAAAVLATGAPLVALGRQLIVDPAWVEKVESGREDEILYTLSKNDQKALTLPDPLWNMVINVPGWFPIVEAEQSAK
ncbi:NADH-dependent flavin oxidoreductase [Paenibacillus wulumuqiensis]|uniref:NADH-dependent flavin oxidoreductase n=1 Tax=Paenibacillus wulumuqiensis TaxID=1567107 RepID=UPI0006191FB1